MAFVANHKRKRQFKIATQGIAENVNEPNFVAPYSTDAVAVAMLPVWPLQTRISTIIFGESFKQKLISFKRHVVSPPLAPLANGCGFTRAATIILIIRRKIS
jgi:hypothetical protein